MLVVLRFILLVYDLGREHSQTIFGTVRSDMTFLPAPITGEVTVIHGLRFVPGIIPRFRLSTVGISRPTRSRIGLFEESHHPAWPSGMIGITIITRSFGVVMRRTTLSLLLIQIEGLRG